MNITAIHVTREDNYGQPLQRTFSRRVFEKIPSQVFNGVLYENGGWKAIKDKKQAPPEAQEVAETNDDKQDVAELVDAIKNGNDATVVELRQVIDALDLDVKKTQPKSVLLKEVKKAIKDE